MNKKKIVVLIASIVMICTLAVGGTLAYFMDTDAETNVFTVGNVQIDLYENFVQNSKLMPTTGKDADGNIINAVEKEVYVLNEGSEAAYVRVHIAIPSVLDDGDPSFNAGKNVLHFNYAEENAAAGKWDWSNSATDGVYAGSNWNYYETTIDNIKYNVYVVTYEKALAKNEATVDAIHQVYLDSKVTNEDISKICAELGNEWKILVAAEGVQVEGFANAHEALNAAFKTPGTYEIEWDTTPEIDNEATA